MLWLGRCRVVVCEKRPTVGRGCISVHSNAALHSRRNPLLPPFPWCDAMRTIWPRRPHPRIRPRPRPPSPPRPAPALRSGGQRRRLQDVLPRHGALPVGARERQQLQGRNLVQPHAEPRQVHQDEERLGWRRPRRPSRDLVCGDGLGSPSPISAASSAATRPRPSRRCGAVASSPLSGGIAGGTLRPPPPGVGGPVRRGDVPAAVRATGAPSLAGSVARGGGRPPGPPTGRPTRSARAATRALPPARARPSPDRGGGDSPTAIVVAGLSSTRERWAARRGGGRAREQERAGATVVLASAAGAAAPDGRAPGVAAPPPSPPLPRRILNLRYF